MNYNHVGRPTNEEVKAKKRKKILLIVIPVIAIFAVVGVIASQGGLNGIMGNSVYGDCPSDGWMLSSDKNYCTRTINQSNVETVEATKYIKGDIDGNGVFNQEDAIKLSTIVKNGSKYSSHETNLYDLDGNGIVNNADVDKLLTTTVAGRMIYQQIEFYDCPESTTENSTYKYSSNDSFKNADVTVTEIKTYTLKNDKCVLSRKKTERMYSILFVQMQKKEAATDNKTNGNSNSKTQTPTSNNNNNSNNNNKQSTTLNDSHYQFQSNVVTKNFTFEIRNSQSNQMISSGVKVLAFNSAFNCKNSKNPLMNEQFMASSPKNSSGAYTKSLSVTQNSKIYITVVSLSQEYTGVAGTVVSYDGGSETRNGSNCVAIKADNSGSVKFKIGLEPRKFFVKYLDSKNKIITSVQTYNGNSNLTVQKVVATKTSKGNSVVNSGWNAYRKVGNTKQYICSNNVWSAKCKTNKRFKTGDKLNLSSTSGDIFFEPIF